MDTFADRPSFPSRRRALAMLLGGAAAGAALPRDAVAGVGSVGSGGSRGAEDLRNPLLWAVAWKQTAAEYRALCHQAFNLARMLLDRALEERPAGSLPPAVVTDLDDTLLHVQSYWGHLVARGLDFFDDDIWDAWIARNLVTAAPGALDFLRHVESRGVEVFYITNRDQGEGTVGHALDHIRILGFPFADLDHLTVLRDTSDKGPSRARVAERFDILLLLGDNLNDFSRDYYVADVDERIRLMERDRELFGRRFVLLPNPTDGHWVRAIFGDSEPPPTDENRRILRAAAMREAWDGR